MNKECFCGESHISKRIVHTKEKCYVTPTPQPMNKDIFGNCTCGHELRNHILIKCSQCSCGHYRAEITPQPQSWETQFDNTFDTRFWMREEIKQVKAFIADQIAAKDIEIALLKDEQDVEIEQARAEEKNSILHKVRERIAAQHKTCNCRAKEILATLEQ